MIVHFEDQMREWHLTSEISTLVELKKLDWKKGTSYEVLVARQYLEAGN